MSDALLESLSRTLKWTYAGLKNRISFWVWVLYTWNAYRMLDIYSDMQRYGSHDILQSFLKAKQMKVQMNSKSLKATCSNGALCQVHMWFTSDTDYNHTTQER